MHFIRSIIFACLLPVGILTAQTSMGPSQKIWEDEQLHPHLVGLFGTKELEPIMHDCFAKESALCDTHKVFYHAHLGYLYVYEDILTRLYERLKKTTVTDYLFLRPWNAKKISGHRN